MCAGPVARHRTRAAAALSAMAGDAVLSHQSAAVIYGAPIWSAPVDRLCITRNRRHGGRIKPHMKVHCAPVESVAEVDGMLLTTPARTIVDLARTLSFETAVVAGDWLAREFGVTAGDLARELEHGRCRRGIDPARCVIRFLNPHCESVGESLSRVMLRGQALALPRSQGEVCTAQGEYLGRVDFYFGDSGVVADFDGRATPGRGGPHPGAAASAVKAREDVLRDNGFQLIRWTWDDLFTDAIAARLASALARAGRLRPAGYIRQAALPEPAPLTIRKL